MHILIAEPVDTTLIEKLSDYGLPIQVMPAYNRQVLFEHLPNVTHLVVRSQCRVNTELLKAAPMLTCVIRIGSGTDNIVISALEEQNIELVSLPQGNRDAVGEQAVGMLLALFNKLHTADLEMRQFLWNRKANTGMEIGGKTIGIIGYGNTGHAFAQKLAGFGATVIAHDKYITGFSSILAQEVSLEELQQRADVISLHIPLNEETTAYLNKPFIDAVTYPFWLLNLARGPIVHTPALIDALQTGKIRGAAIDVFENEDWNNLTESQQYEILALSKMSNVIMTPHTGGLTVESEQRLMDLTLQALLQRCLKTANT
jgi:D-3-phosphoglycerate dehydrogenase / 2-oxoglutarate reductase